MATRCGRPLEGTSPCPRRRSGDRSARDRASGSRVSGGPPSALDARARRSADGRRAPRRARARGGRGSRAIGGIGEHERVEVEPRVAGLDRRRRLGLGVFCRGRSREIEGSARRRRRAERGDRPSSPSPAARPCSTRASVGRRPPHRLRHGHRQLFGGPPRPSRRSLRARARRLRRRSRASRGAERPRSPPRGPP